MVENKLQEYENRNIRISPRVSLMPVSFTCLLGKTFRRARGIGACEGNGGELEGERGEMRKRERHICGRGGEREDKESRNGEENGINAKEQAKRMNEK